jgi:CDP-diacylglycerol--glycerol-3-phosphate 3-phosphatidyltransferase
MLETKVRPLVQGLTESLAGALAQAGVASNALTAISFAGTAAGAALAAAGRFGAAGAVFIPSGIAGLLDGPVGRATGRATRWGTYLDSVIDRLSDAAMLGAIAWHLRLERPRAAAVAIAALALAFLVSYTKARASSLGYRCDVGLAGGADRVVLAAAALVIPGAAETALWVLAGLFLVTTLQRAGAVWKQAAGE